MRPFDWAGLWRPTLPPWEVALRAAIVYVFVIALLRLIGRKELSRYATFDVVLLFLVAVALRKTLVDDDQSLTSGMVAIATLAGLDWVFSWLSFRSPRFARIVAGPVRLLVKDGQPIERELRRSRISRDELLAHLRQYGRRDLADVEAAFLERSGRVTFLFRDRPGC